MIRMPKFIKLSPATLCGKTFLVGVIISLVNALPCFAQNYPATLKVPVTFYDFHSNGSNPEFERPHVPGVHLNMVALTLDNEKKPQLGTVPYLDYGIAKWYRPWVAGDFQIPNYATTSPYNYTGMVTRNYDTAFKNIVIDTFLIFTYVPNSPGVYQYINDTFFILDNKGFGREGLNHNFSYTMELHWQFTKESGLTFNFAGDDDVWAFIDNRLAMDLGGIHQKATGAVVVDNIPNLTNGNQYSFDLFYAERHTVESHIEITTNIISAKPSAISMTVIPDADTIAAGDSIRYIAVVKDQNDSVINDYNQFLKWTLTPSNTASSLKNTNGLTNTFYAVDAYQTYYIMVSLDTVTGYGVQVHLSWSDTVYVKPGPPTHLTIEANADSTISLRDDNRMYSDVISSTTQKDSVYAILRDKYGNWVSHATLAAWLSRDTTIVTAAPGNTSLGEGVITRRTAILDTTYISASQGTYMDSLRVIISNVNYSQIQIYVISGGIKPIDTLKMRTDQDTTLHARGLRADGSGFWDDLLVAWHNSPQLTFNNTAPPVSLLWSFNPQDTGSGTISITYGSSPALSDTIKAFFTPGNAFREALYPLPGQPNTTTNAPLPATATLAAGTPYQMVAKIFDSQNLWLSSYERTNAPITWTMTEMSNNGITGTLSATSGYLTVFTPRRAYNIVKTTATFQDNAITVPPQSIIINVVPGPVEHLVIEGDTSRLTSPNSDNPKGTVLMGARDTSAAVYGILRDIFGNWVGYSQSTDWLSVDTNQAKAKAGNPRIGEGVINRISKNGQTLVIASDLDSALHGGHILKDTVIVILSAISYDSLRIVVRDTVLIQTLTMRTDQDTLLQVQGKRSDNGRWEAVSADWAIVPVLRTTPVAPKSANSWRFTPLDTGASRISASLGTSVPDTINVHFIHGLPYSLVLYPTPGAPGADNVAFPSPGTALIDTAGKPLQMVAKIFDKNGVWIGDYERATAPIDWNMVELTGNPPTGTLNAALGYLNVFTPARAYNTIYIVAKFDTAGYPSYSDTVLVRVVPGKPKQLVIEADQNWQSSPNSARPVDSIQIASTETYRSVYAIIRDSLGNYINYSRITDWKSQDPTVVTAGDGLTSIGQGIVRRIDTSGSTFVSASSLEYSGLTDTIKVIVLKYYYIALEIDVRQTVSIDSLAMSTNDDTTLYVRGKRSDTAAWEPVSAKWENSQGLVIDPSAPERAQSWSFSPVRPAASGWIRVTLGNDSLTKPDSVFVVFRPGAVTAMTIAIITPPDKRIAGDTITAVVKLFNKDGLYPDSSYCDTTIHQESLGSGGRPDPVVIVDDKASKLNQAPSTASKTEECFQFGLDTIKYVLYYSTTTKDSLQRMYITFNSIIASTDPFNLLPARLNSVAIQDGNGNNLDTVHLASPNGSQVFKVVGYDRFGNKVVLVNGATWTATDHLHPIDKPFDVTRIYYDAIQVKNDEYGHIIAAVVDSAGKSISDSVWVTISGQPVPLIAAITGDANGNGYLDQIELHFERAATITSKYDSTMYVTLPTGDKIWVDSIRGIQGASDTTDSVFIAYFTEKPTGAMGQTAWTPAITATQDIKGIAPIVNSPTKDGAGPVIMSVVKEVNSLEDRTKDVVTVTFSEPIQSSDNNSFKIGIPPDLVLYVWTKGASGTYLRDSIVIDSINTFNEISNGNTSISFSMTNNRDLIASDFLSIRILTDSCTTDINACKIASCYIADKSERINIPSVNNQKVPVTVLSTIPNTLIVGPNPATPTFRRKGPGVLELIDEPNALTWVTTDRGGTVLQFSVVRTSNPKQSVTGYLKIYDVVGNPVYEAIQNDDILTDYSRGLGDSTVYKVHIYWNGSNKKGMKVAPGVYQAFLYLTFNNPPSPAKKQKLVGAIGIKR